MRKKEDIRYRVRVSITQETVELFIYIGPPKKSMYLYENFETALKYAIETSKIHGFDLKINSGMCFWEKDPIALLRSKLYPGISETYQKGINPFRTKKARELSGCTDSFFVNSDRYIEAEEEE
jgi:hypothetical protein